MIRYQYSSVLSLDLDFWVSTLSVPLRFTRQRAIFVRALSIDPIGFGANICNLHRTLATSARFIPVERSRRQFPVNGQGFRCRRRRCFSSSILLGAAMRSQRRRKCLVVVQSCRRGDLGGEEPSQGPSPISDDLGLGQVGENPNSARRKSRRN
ncbi:hypothetical protein U1Q18_035624 [Sarracenia purpurea var. burkii]